VVSYTKGLQRVVNDSLGEVPVTYPMRISFELSSNPSTDLTEETATPFFLSSSSPSSDEQLWPGLLSLRELPHA
jgi:hypothetical protein